MAIEIFKRILIPLVGWTLSIASARAVGASVDWLGLGACILGIFSAYRLDHVLDRPGGLLAAEARQELGVIAAAALLLLGIALAQPSLFAPLAVLGALGVFYIPLKKFIPKNLLTASAWAVCIVTLSLQLTPLSREHAMATALIFFLVLSNATLCDLPDIERDREDKVVGLVPAFGTRTGGRIAAAAACTSLVIAAALESAAFAIPCAVYIVLGAGFSTSVASHPKQRWLLDAVLVLPGPISLLA
jgi:4-hydroxybenzoate polyprenyltransferase